MPYSVKLKDQTGTEIIYNSVEQVSLPQASGTANAEFMAKYKAKAEGNTGEIYYGGDTAAHGVDYVCCLSHPSTPIDLKSLKIGGVEAEKDAYKTDYFSGVGDSGCVIMLKIYGEYITGDIDLLFNNA